MLKCVIRHIPRPVGVACPVTESRFTSGTPLYDNWSYVCFDKKLTWPYESNGPSTLSILIRVSEKKTDLGIHHDV